MNNIKPTTKKELMQLRNANKEIIKKNESDKEMQKKYVEISREWKKKSGDEPLGSVTAFVPLRRKQHVNKSNIKSSPNKPTNNKEENKFVTINLDTLLRDEKRKQGSNGDKKRYNIPYRGGKIAYKFGNSMDTKYINRKQKTNATKRKVSRVKRK